MVRKIAKNQEQVAARNLLKIRQAFDEQCVRLNELGDYREQYSKKLAATGEQGVGAMEINNYRVFVEQLGIAFQQQQLVVERFQSELNQANQEWTKKRTHTQAVEKLIEGFSSDEQFTENSREQKILDEYAMRSGFKLGN